LQLAPRYVEIARQEQG